MLFAFSILPRKALHDWLVSHTDGTAAVAKSPVDQVSKAGFNCAIQNLVAESPFTESHHSIDLSFFPIYTIVGGSIVSSVFTPVVSASLLRGPPFIA